MAEPIMPSCDDSGWSVVDIDEIEAAYQAARGEHAVLGAATAAALGAVPRLLAEIRYARAALERWRSLHPMGRSYTLTEDGHPPNAWHSVSIPTVGLDQADAAAAEREQGRGPTPWVKTAYESPWRRHELPPF